MAFEKDRTNDVTIDYPEGLEKTVSTTWPELEAQIRLRAALNMFELGKLSSGMAAQLAGISWEAFFDMCGRYHVPSINYAADEIEAELVQDLAALQN